MTKLLIFISVLTGFVIVLAMGSFKSLPVTNEKFNLAETAVTFTEKQKLITELLAPKAPIAEEDEVVVKEYAPYVELNTPQLEKGNRLFNQCISCHGKGGEGKTSQKAPFIGGQFDWYIEKQLSDMKSGVRYNQQMAIIVKGLSEQDIKDLANYISKLPWKKEVEGAAE